MCKLYERQVEKHLMKKCKEHGIQYRKVGWLGTVGAPDRLLYINGGVYVELKAPGEELRKIQRHEHELMRNGGMQVFTIDTIEGVDYLFREELGL
jgi:hypothetical protein